MSYSFSMDEIKIKEVFELRKQGRKEEAYEAARRIYASDRGPYASTAMFWTAVDVLTKRANENRTDEAQKIYLALERLLPTVKDEKGWMLAAMNRCKNLLNKAEARVGLLNNGPQHLKMGAWGEELAAAYLREKGYVILERDWHSVHRDIDIIAQQDNCIVFVEVKARHKRDYGEPQQAVNYKKRKNLRLAINHYIHYRKLDKPWRFDVITIVGEMGNEMPEINHIENFCLT